MSIEIFVDKPVKKLVDYNSNLVLPIDTLKKATFGIISADFCKWFNEAVNRGCKFGKNTVIFEAFVGGIKDEIMNRLYTQKMECHVYMIKSMRHVIGCRYDVFFAMGDYSVDDMTDSIYILSPKGTFLVDKDEIMELTKEQLARAISIYYLLSNDFKFKTISEIKPEEVEKFRNVIIQVITGVKCNALYQMHEIYYNRTKKEKFVEQYISQLKEDCRHDNRVFINADSAIDGLLPESVISLIKANSNSYNIPDYYMDYIMGKRMSNDFVVYQIFRRIKADKIIPINERSKVLDWIVGILKTNPSRKVEYADGALTLDDFKVEPYVF